MQKLTSLDRVMKAINRQEPDRVPTFEIIINQKVINAIKTGSSYVDFCEYMDLDAVCYFEMKSRRYEMLDKRKRIARDEWGAIKQFTEVDEHNPVPREPAINSERDLENYTPPDPDLPFRYTEIEQGVKRFKGKRAIIATVMDPFNTVKDSILGEVNLFQDIIRNPGFVDQLSQIASDYNMRYVKNCIDIGADIIWVTGDYAITKGPMISPRHTERFLMPGLKQIVQYCHSKGVPCVKHSDGNIWAIFDLLIETGIDAINPIDPTAGMDLGEVKSKYGDKVCLIGNVDCGALLSWGTTEEVHEKVKECIRKAGKGGGYICTSSNSIHAGVKPENYLEMIKTIRDYGRYPLSGL